MKTHHLHILLAIASTGAALAVLPPPPGAGPLTPPPGADPTVGPLNALSPGGAPQPTMKTLHQVEPRTPLNAGSPGVTQEANGGFTIAATGSYYLTNNLDVASGNGITITADRVTLDLNGFSITSSSASVSGVGIEVSGFHPSLTVRNGFIVGGTTVTPGAGGLVPMSYTPHGFSSGVLSTTLGPAGSVYVATIEDLDVRGCADKGIYVTGGKYRNCTVDGCGGIGLGGAMATDCTVARCGGAYALYSDVVTRCEVLSNNGDGIQAHSVDQSAAFQNGGIGIKASLVTNCKAEINVGFGIDAETVRDCVSADNIGVGIRADGGVVSQCLAAGNTQDGIRAYGGVVSQCQAFGNVQNGIQANYPAVITGCSSRLNGMSGISSSGGSIIQCVASQNAHNGIYIFEGVIANCHATGNNTSLNNYTDFATFSATRTGNYPAP